jgi:ATP-binding cassette subfamily B protein
MLVVLGWETLAGRLSLGSFVLYYQLLNRGQSTLRIVLKSALTLYENSQFLAGFTALLQLKPQIREPEHPQPLAHPLQQSIQFENVSFNYGEHRVLDQLNFIIPAGQTVAFVGKNGAGKTTLIKLLCRLYDPAQGRILVDGQDLRQVSLIAWRSQITAVFQDFCRYHFSVLENLRLAVPDATLAEIRQAIQTVGLSPRIERLAHQEETILGYQFQDGAELSLGEWQKLAIARCFLRPRPVLIFDEPTSAIDPQAEADLLMALKTLVRDRTAVIISHRLSTVQWCDCIFVLDTGRIVEQGRHEELLARSGLYAQLYTAQSQFYRTLDTD